MGWVYFITTEEADRVKIGFTRNNPQARLRELQTGSPFLLCVIAAINGSVTDEWKLHAKFADQRLHGEWFAFDREIKDYVIELNRQAAEHSDSDYWPKWVRVFHAMQNGASVEEADAI